MAEAGRFRFVEDLAQNISGKANAQIIYGAPIEREGVTVIPVGKIKYGVGGGMGTHQPDEEGAGGGGGVSVSPVGYIEIKSGASRFRRFDSATQFLQGFGGFALGTWLILRGLRGLRKS